MLLQINPSAINPRQIDQAVKILADGGVIAYPTDTTYGLGCSIFSKKGIERIYRIKQRADEKPFSFICSDISEISKYAFVDNFSFKIMKKYLPGPYTFILKSTKIVPELLMSKQKTVGIRIPDNPVCLAIERKLGNPIVTTSANHSGDEPIGDPYIIDDKFGSLVDIVIDTGILDSKVSTVISLIDSKVEILREGVGDISWCHDI